MSTVINTNVAATRIHNVYNRNNTEMNAAMTRVATAQKINSAKDGASTWAISEKMRERIRANDQANQNVQNDTALLKTAQGGLSNTLDILYTLKERAINSANDSNVNSDRTKIVEEVKQLVQQIDDNADKVKFNGRALLNGATDPSSGATSASSTASATPVTASGTYGNMAVYSITGLNKASTNGAGNGLTAATATDTLVSLVDSNGSKLFQAGDKITLNWTDNGESKEKSLTVTSDTVFADLTGSNLTSFAGTDGTALTGVEDANGEEVLAQGTGVYFKGAANHNISDFSISVTNSSGSTKAAAQAALQPTAVQQSYGDTSYGSNMVYSLSVTASSAGDDTVQFYTLGTNNKDKSTTSYTLNVDGKTITFSGGDTINSINEQLAKNGFNVRLHNTAAGDTLNYDGQTVTKGTYGGAINYTAAVAGLSFISAPGESINYIEITAKNGATDLSEGSFAGKKTDEDSSIERALKLDTTSSSSSTASSSLLPQGEALQFYVGGEQNFGVNFTIGKATVQTLFGSSVDGFANKFSTAKGAEAAISTIDTAINKALTEQTRLGAMESRLGYTSDNITTMNENLEAGVSAFRDADIAREMTQYMKYSVLAQSSQYMLAQASQNAFSVLNLLQA